MPWPSSPRPGQTGGVFTWTVMPAPDPVGALTVGATADGLALVAFGDHPEAAAQAAERLGLPAVAHEPARSNRQVSAVDGAPGRLWTDGVSGGQARDAARLTGDVLDEAAVGARPRRPKDVLDEAAAGKPTQRPEDVLDQAAAGTPTRQPEAELGGAAAEPGQRGEAGAIDAEAVLEQAVAQLREYFAGGRRVFDVPLDWSLTRGSQRRVLETLFATVGYGATATYGELAARSELGSAYTAARGVGAIMGSNPLPVVVPCHRVMAADGLGGFGGGRATKEWLLAHEGVLTGALDFG